MTNHFQAPLAATRSAPTPLPLHQSKARATRLFRSLVALAVSGPLCLGTASAASFTVSADSTSAQTLGSGSGQTGTVNAGKTLSVSDGTVAVTVSGNNATLTNLGTITQTGTGRAVRDNTGVTGLVVNNGSATNSSALMQTADADVIQMNKAVSSVTLNNYGSMISLNASAGGAQAVDFSAITSGSNVVNNFAGGVLKAFEADAVRPGVNGVVNNYGTIWSVTSTGSSSDGVDAQNNSGVTVNNYATGVITGARHGITGGALDATVTFTMLVTNTVGGVIQGWNGAGINIDGFNANQVVTIVNGGSIYGTGVTGDGDGVDVDGLVNITNTGTIRSLNAFSTIAAGLAYSEAISVGGGTIVNSGTIDGLVSAGNTNAVGRGITVVGNDITTGPLAGTREAIYGNTTITNQAGGLIRGQTDSAIVVDGPKSGYTVTINNEAGATIQGGGSTAAAIKTGADNDTVNNAGTVNGSSSGKAIDLGAGDNKLNITGGSAVITGDISGGVGGTNTMVVNPGAGNSFSYAGSISNFNTVEVQSGLVTLSGASTYSGTTIISGGTLVLNGADRLSSTSALTLAGGALKLTHVSGANAQTFASLSLTNDSSIDLGGSSLTFNGLGTVVAGKHLTIEGYDGSLSPDYAFRFLGDWSSNADFLGLMSASTINGFGASYFYDGTYTDVRALTAVPEPESYAMMFGGLGVLAAFMRRRKEAVPA